MRRFLLATICCTAVFLCGSCDGPAEVAYLDVTDAAAVPVRSLEIGPQGADCSLRVQATGEWSLETPDWIEADRTSGNGTGDVALSVLPYTEKAVRESMLIIRQAMDVVYVTVRQEGGAVVTAALRILDTGGDPLEELNVPFGGLHAYIRVETPESWELTPSEAWMNASSSGSTGSSEVYISVEANRGSASRRGTFTFRTPANTAVLEIIQNGEPEIEPVQAPKADLLDVEFAADGSAKDLSAAALSVVRVASASMGVSYNESYKRYCAVFNPAALGDTVTEGFYYADFENNTTVRKGLEDSHSLEILLCSRKLPAGSLAVKPFSLMNNGGSGFLYAKSTNLTAQRRFCFLPYIGGSYRYVVADGVGLGTWHHVVGVWDSKAGMSYIYVDGRLSGSTETPGAYTHADETANHFVIGGDAAKGLTSAQSSYCGEIAVARAYSMALSAGEVLWLYNSLGQ